jgi:hypothetical protein
LGGVKIAFLERFLAPMEKVHYSSAPKESEIGTKIRPFSSFSMLQGTFSKNHENGEKSTFSEIAIFTKFENPKYFYFFFSSNFINS